MRPFSTAWWRQERRSTEQRWYLWPVTLVLAVYGLGGFAWLIYNGWWAGAAFTAAWMTALVVMFAPSRNGWRRRRQERGSRG
jgi:hypothetical protein